MLRYLMVVAVLLPPVPAAAFDVEDLNRFLSTGLCPACDLSQADLRSYDSAGGASPVDLRAANLSGAKLDGVRLEGALLAGANLSGAQLDTARLEQADLRGANLAGAMGSFLDAEGANLSGANLRGFDACYDQNFAEASLRGADLSGARLCATVWWGADLSGATLDGADLTLAIELTQLQLDRACGDAATVVDNADLQVRTCDAR